MAGSLVFQEFVSSGALVSSPYSQMDVQLSVLLLLSIKLSVTIKPLGGCMAP